LPVGRAGQFVVADPADDHYHGVVDATELAVAVLEADRAGVVGAVPTKHTLGPDRVEHRHAQAFGERSQCLDRAGTDDADAGDHRQRSAL
jgi:hypothetical protein